MARKPIEKLGNRTSGAGGASHQRQDTPRGRKSAPAGRGSSDSDTLRKDLAAARVRIAELEKAQREVLRRLESAIDAIHTLFGNQ